MDKILNYYHNLKNTVESLEQQLRENSMEQSAIVSYVEILEEKIKSLEREVKELKLIVDQLYFT